MLVPVKPGTVEKVKTEMAVKAKVARALAEGAKVKAEEEREAPKGALIVVAKAATSTNA
jgi:hypothetical protein